MRLDVKGWPTFVATAGPPPTTAEQVAVLLHGAGMAASIWAAQLTSLATDRRAVLAPTLPGHGRAGASQSSDGPTATTIAEHADWLASLLNSLGAARAVVVGHSMGALIAVEAARRHRSRVAALGLLGAATALRVHPALLEAARTQPAVAAERILEWGFAQRQGGRPPGLSLVNVGRRMLVASEPGVLAADLAACNVWDAGDLGGLVVPALVLVGGRDRMAPAKAGRALAAALPTAELQELPASGHMMMVEEPRVVTAALRSWLGRLSASATEE